MNEGLRLGEGTRVKGWQMAAGAAQGTVWSLGTGIVSAVPNTRALSAKQRSLDPSLLELKSPGWCWSRDGKARAPEPLGGGPGGRWGLGRAQGQTCHRPPLGGCPPRSRGAGDARPTVCPQLSAEGGKADGEPEPTCGGALVGTQTDAVLPVTLSLRGRPARMPIQG